MIKKIEFIYYKYKSNVVLFYFIFTMSDNEDYYTGEYDDDTGTDNDRDDDYDDDYPGPRHGPPAPCVLCECKACYQKNNAEVSLADVIAAYHERNYDYWINPTPNQEFPETPEDRAHYELHMRDQIRCNRHVVLTHRGFRVSLPEPLGVSSQYRHSCPEDEVSENDEKMHQLVVQGLWSDEIQKGYKNLIDDFKYSEAQSYWKTTPHTAFPRHEMLVAASFTSSIAMLEKQLWRVPLKCVYISAISIPFGCMDPAAFMSKSKSKAMALAPASSIFTETTARQRSKLLAYSGIAGKLIVQLFANCGGMLLHSQPIRIRNSAFTMTQRVHSLATCEILMDNRYWYRGNFDTDDHADADNEIPMSMNEMIAEFRELYRDHIDEVKCAALKYKNGLVNIGEIQSDPIKTKFYSLMIRCLKQLMRLDNDNNRGLMKRSNRVMKFIAEFPDIFHKDIARMHGLCTMRLRMSTRETQLRLANEGSYYAFLSFAASEPQMVDAFLAPEVGTRYGGVYSVSDRENNVSSRHRVFGELLKTHRRHLPRTAEVMGDICRSHVLL